jgi:hypothetical protein
MFTILLARYFDPAQDPAPKIHGRRSDNAASALTLSNVALRIQRSLLGIHFVNGLVQRLDETVPLTAFKLSACAGPR